MIGKGTSRRGCNQATRNGASTRRKPSAFGSWVKETIVARAIWGLIPVRFADWLIRIGGLRDA